MDDGVGFMNLRQGMEQSRASWWGQMVGYIARQTAGAKCGSPAALSDLLSNLTCCTWDQFI